VNGFANPIVRFEGKTETLLKTAALQVKSQLKVEELLENEAAVRGSRGSLKLRDRCSCGWEVDGA